MWRSQKALSSHASLESTFHLVVFVLRIKSSAHPHNASRHGSQTITHSSFQMDVPVSVRVRRMPPKVGHFNYMCTQLSPPLKARRLITMLDVQSAFPLCLTYFPGGSRASPVSHFDEVPYTLSCLGETTLRLVSVSNFNLSQL